MNFDGVKDITIPEGKVKKVTVAGMIRWLKEMKLGPVFLGQAPALPSARGYMAGASNANLVFFGGGTTDGTAVVNTVTTYDANLVQGSAKNLNSAVAYATGGEIGDYALIAGGISLDSSGDASCNVAAYDLSGTKTRPESLDGFGECMGFPFADKFCFVCKDVTFTDADDNGFETWGNFINYYSKDLVKSRVNNLFGTALGLSASGETVREYAAAAAGEYLITVGGRVRDVINNENTDAIYQAFVFDSNFTHIQSFDITDKWDYRRYEGIGMGDIALFINKYAQCANNPPGYIFDKNLVQIEIPGDESCVAAGGYCLWSNLALCGGKAVGVWYFYLDGADGTGTEMPFAIDQNGVCHIEDAHTDNLNRDEVAVATLGNKMFIGGGYSSTGASALVDVMELQ